MATYSTRLFEELEDETGQATGYRSPGSISVAADEERWQEILRGASMATSCGVETEVMVWGRIPLAYSARCYTARANNLPKDRCEERCIEDPDGKLMYTREDQAFLAINGIQTQSAQTYNLLAQFGEMSEMGVDIVRVSPQSVHTMEVLDLCRQAVIDPAKGSALAAQAEQYVAEGGSCLGYWYGGAGFETTAEAAAAL